MNYVAPDREQLLRDVAAANPLWSEQHVRFAVEMMPTTWAYCAKIAEPIIMACECCRDTSNAIAAAIRASDEP